MSSQLLVPQKNNKAFMILSALGIRFVIDAHVVNGMSFFTQIFPYDSFFMPMFIFISGYFFNEKHVASFRTLLNYIKNKAKKLLLPYFFFIVLYGLLTTFLRELGLITFGKLTLPELLNNVLFYGISFEFNDPSWFVQILFCVCVLYAILRKLFKPVWNDIAVLAITVLVGAAAVYFSKTEFLSPETVMLLKLMFFTQFYQLGYVFKKYLENIFDKINALYLCAAAICINLFLIALYGNNIAFPSCTFMAGFHTQNYFLPFITSVTGTLFWLKISKVLVSVLGENRLVNYISDNTFFIMTNHLLFKSLFTGVLILGKKASIPCLSGIDVSEFKASAWYVYADFAWSRAAAFLFTLVATVLACKIYTFMKFKLQNIISSKKT